MKVETVLTDYAAIRSKLRTGDMVFTSHRSAFGRVIHLGQGFRRPWHAMIVARPGDRVEVLESTAAEAGGKGKRGVQVAKLSDRIDATNGEVWVSPLSNELRNWLDEEKMLRWMVEQEGRDYSYGQAIWAGLDGLIRILPENTWSKSYMCSRFAMAAIRNGLRDEKFAGYYIAREASPTPAQLSRMRGFYAVHWQVKGAKLHEIGGRV